MRRREFMTLLGGAAVAWPHVARAQQLRRVPRLGVLMSFSESDPEAQSWVRALLQGLKELNWTDGRNIQMDVRFGAGDASRRPTLAKELVESIPDVIVTGGTPAITAISHETRNIPIVFVHIADPVELGLLENYSRPGGNITGFTLFEFTVGQKWLQLLQEISPKVSQVTILLDTQNPSWPQYLHAAFLGLRSDKKASEVIREQP